MVKDIELNAKIREKNNLKTLREKGFIPAVIYGKGEKNISLSIDYEEFRKIFKQAGENTIIKLKIEDKTKNVLVHDVAKDPVTDKFIHIDFYQIRMDKIITAEVPLVFEGEPPAVKNLDGILIKNVTEVEIESLPGDLPHEIKVDISILETFDDSIRVSDLKLPENVKIKTDPEETIVSVNPPRTEEEIKELEEKPEEEEEPEKIDEESTGEKPAEEEIKEE